MPVALNSFTDENKYNMYNKIILSFDLAPVMLGMSEKTSQSF